MLSEDCLNYDLYSGTGKASLHVWKMSDDETQALLACTTEYGMDIYRYNFTTSDITYLFRGSLESSPVLPDYNGYYFSDLGDNLVSQGLMYSDTGLNEIRAWNWKTGELLWTNDSNNIAGINVKVAEDGWVYYTYIEHLETGNYLNLAAYNVVTGEEGAPPPLVMENIYAAIPAVKGRPELIFFSGGEGPITSSEPRIPTGRKYYYLWDRNTDVVRRLTLLPISYGSGGLVGGQVPPLTAFYSRQGGSYP
ncbi:hypothetical protein KKF34_04070, partial [Myxococcota bacterium]|nr:hypothetical protein [Myxococcota bacterium]